jgi:tetratricopeptide (TPR) repeat protein
VTGKTPRTIQRITSLPLAQREVALLLILSVAAAVLFLATRTLAGWSRGAQSRDAAAWYGRGQAALEAGRPGDAVPALRRAVQADRLNRAYAVALARGLMDSGHADEAWQILQRLRETAIDDTDINHRLAQLAVRRGDLADALRYYHNAMYGLGGPTREATRRAIAVELSRVLLDHGAADKALAELIALAADLDAGAPEQLPLAHLLLQAGDPARALRLFTQAAARGASSADALTGAGDAALALHDLGRATREWHAAARLGAEVSARLHLVDAIEHQDPLARGLSRRERGRRLAAALDESAARLAACPASESAAPQTEIQAFRRTHPAMGVAPDDDTLAAGVGIAGRAMAAIGRACGTPDNAEIVQVWHQIAARHPEGRP